jgi:hypothetical protein
MNILLERIQDYEFKLLNETDLNYRYNIIVFQIEELKKANYDII